MMGKTLSEKADGRNYIFLDKPAPACYPETHYQSLLDFV